MKKYNVIALSMMAVMLTACNSGQKVEVAKATDTSVIKSVQVCQPAQLPQNLPNNITAICKDGSYSTATGDSACAGNGGVSTIINRYSAE